MMMMMKIITILNLMMMSKEIWVVYSPLFLFFFDSSHEYTTPSHTHHIRTVNSNHFVHVCIMHVDTTPLFFFYLFAIYWLRLKLKGKFFIHFYIKILSSGVFFVMVVVVCLCVCVWDMKRKIFLFLWKT